MMGDHATMKLANVNALCQWANLPFDKSRQRVLAKLLPGFQDRVRRLDDISVEDVEYAFQKPVDTPR